MLQVLQGEPLRGKDVLQCIKTCDSDGRAWFKVVNRDTQPTAKLPMVSYFADFRGVEMEVKQYPVKYYPVCAGFCQAGFECTVRLAALREAER